jgi:hypothetical protein
MSKSTGLDWDERLKCGVVSLAYDFGSHTGQQDRVPAESRIPTVTTTVLKHEGASCLPRSSPSLPFSVDLDQLEAVAGAQSKQESLGKSSRAHTSPSRRQGGDP